jgi:hypothetical protein
MFHLSRDSFRNGVLGFGIRQDKITDIAILRSWVDAKPNIKSRLFSLIREDQLSRRDIIASFKTKKEAEVALRNLVAYERLNGRDVFVRGNKD